MLSEHTSTITINDIQQLISDSIPEGKRVDYKQTLFGNADADKKEFLSDVSSFANTQGGFLIFGVTESSGLPISLSPITSPDPDKEIQRMDSLIQSGIEPRINYEIKSVPSGSDYIFIIYIKQSWNAPHRVIFKSHDKFYARNSAGKYPLDTNELRDLFTLSMSINEKVENKIKERRSRLGSMSLPIQSDLKRRVSLHLIPLESIRNVQLPNIFTLNSDIEFAPIDLYGMNFEINFEGLMSSSKSGDGILYTYAQIHRDGMIEAVNGRLVTDDGRVATTLIEKELISALENYLKCYRKLGIAVPIVGYLSFYNMQGTRADPPRRTSRSSNILNENNLYLPSFLIEDYSVSAGKILKPSFDVFWNAYGFEGTPNLNSDGAWIGSN